jgi:predicted CXXCH cytochrome family protein
MTKILLSAVAVLIFSNPSFAVITGSAHDFSASTPSGEICILCHTPHGADTTVTNAPLWNHEVTATATFTPYDNTSATQDSTPGQPNGVSKLCLSCHDNTVAIDAFGGAAGDPTDLVATYDLGGTKTAGYANIGTDLSDDHPIGILYDSALVTADGGLNALATATTVGTDTIADMLFSSMVECASCHDVHNAFGNANLLYRSNANSELCLTCHAK